MCTMMIDCFNTEHSQVFNGIDEELAMAWEVREPADLRRMNLRQPDIPPGMWSRLGTYEYGGGSLSSSVPWMTLCVVGSREELETVRLPLALLNHRRFGGRVVFEHAVDSVDARMVTLAE